MAKIIILSLVLIVLISDTTCLHVEGLHKERDSRESNSMQNCCSSSVPSQVHVAGNVSCLGMSSSNASVHQCDACSPWFFCQNGMCKRGQLPPDELQFGEDGRLSVLGGCCATYEANRNSCRTEVGQCVYYTRLSKNAASSYDIYRELPSNASQLSGVFCDRYNRQGTLCGQCKDDHFPLAYSFDLTCVKCPHSKTNWIKYVSVAFVPLTVFYLVILMFKISIMSSHLYGFVMYSQAISMPILVRVLIISCQERPKYFYLVKTLGSLYGIWNLDFFRMFDLGICLKTSTLAVISLDLIVAVYPLLLMIVTYLMIHLHDRSFAPLIVLWWPFRYVFSLFCENWDIRTSLIDSFATFFLLSNVKFLSVAFDLLRPVNVYQLSNSEHNYSTSQKLYYDATIHYFGSTHLPYAILAIVVLVVFVLLPVLILMLYPFRWFQKILNVLPVRWHVLHTFMDSFQGCYKDGTEPGTRDCRWFASVFFVARSFLFMVSMFGIGSIYPIIGSIVSTFFGIFLLICRPYKAKVDHYSDITAIFVFLLGLFYASLAGIEFSMSKSHEVTWFLYVVALMFALLPLIYVSTIVLHWVVHRRKFGLEVFQRWQARRGYQVLK